MRKKILLLLLLPFLVSCGDAPPKGEFSIAETADISFFTETEAQPEETQPETWLLLSQYDMDTEITDHNGKTLVNLINGVNQFSENGLVMAGISREIAENGLIAPRITYSTSLDTQKTQECLSIMENAFNGFGLEGCVIVSDMNGRINIIANYTKLRSFFQDGIFLIREDDDRFDETDTEIIIHSEPEERYEKKDLEISHTYANYHSHGTYIGSTAKLFSSIVMLDHQDQFPASSENNIFYDEALQDFVYYDKGVISEYIPDNGMPSISFYPALYNSGGKAYARPIRTQLCDTSGNMTNAFVSSVNTFYANAYLQLELRDIIQTFNQYFGLNKFGTHITGYTVPCDWMEIPQPDLALISQTAVFPEFVRARLAYGMASGKSKNSRNEDDIQNYFSIAPVYLNAVSGLMATGNLYPLSVREDTPAVPVYENQDSTNDYSQISMMPLQENFRVIMWNLMHSTALHYGLNDTEDYQFYVKTGTADDSNFKHLLMTGFVTDSDVNDDDINGKIITIYAYDGFGISKAEGRGEDGFASLLTSVYREIAATVM